MSFLISDLYSVAPVQNIEWFLYVVDNSENAEGTVEGRYVRENMLKIGQELGASAAFVVGANGKPQRQIYDLWQEYLGSEILETVQLVTSGCMSIVATRQALPHTDAMAIIPLSDKNTPFDSPERAAEAEGKIRKIIDAIKDGSFQKLIDGGDTLQIQQGDFNLPINDSAFVVFKKLNKWVRLKIPLIFAEVDVAGAIDDLLAKKYPKINR